MDDVTLQRILHVLERIEAELKARRSAPEFPPAPQPPAPYWPSHWGYGRPFDPFIVTS